MCTYVPQSGLAICEEVFQGGVRGALGLRSQSNEASLSVKSSVWRCFREECEERLTESEAYRGTSLIRKRPPS